MRVLLAATLALTAAAEPLAACVADEDRVGDCPDAGSAAAAKFLKFRQGRGVQDVPAAGARETPDTERQLRTWSTPNSECPMFGDGRVSTPQRAAGAGARTLPDRRASRGKFS